MLDRFNHRERDIDYSQHDFVFTKGWFIKRNREAFIQHVMPRFKDTPCLYLEIGVYEGCSMCWMFQNVLTHPGCRAVGIDPWLATRKLDEGMAEALRARAIHNIKPYADRCTFLRMTSADALRAMTRRTGRWGMRRNRVDLCMIDGQHSDLAVLDDARHVIQLVKIGGWILFDDVEKKEQSLAHAGMLLWEQEVGERVKKVWDSTYMQAFERVS